MNSSKWLLFLILIFCTLSETSFAESLELSEKNPLSEKDIRRIYDQGWQLLSQIHKDKTALDEAIELYEESLASSPRNANLHWMLAEMLFKKAETIHDQKTRQDLYEKALNEAKKALELNPDSLEAHFWVGSCSAVIAEMLGTFGGIKLINRAIDELELAFKMDPANRYSILAGAVLTTIYTEAPWPMRDLDKAERFGQEAVSRDNNLTLASIKLAKVYAKQEKYEKARKEAGRCLSLKHPTYTWDAELYDWPSAKRLLKEMED